MRYLTYDIYVRTIYTCANATLPRSSIRDDELEHVKTMFACERGKGALTSPNAAAATPRWDEDAAAELGFEEDDGDGVKSSSRGGGGRPTTTTAAAAGGRNEINGLEGSSLRTDVARKTPLEVFSSAFDPLRKLVEAVEKEEVPRNGAGAAAAVGGGEEHRPAAVLNGAREGGEEGQQREEEGVEDGGVVAATKNGGGEGIGKRIPSSSDSGENLSENRSEESV